MTQIISVPFWLFLVLSACSMLVFVRFVVFPLWARFWIARTRNAIEEVNPLLQLHMSSFTLSKRRVLADRLVCDPIVEKGMERIARERGISTEKLRREAWGIAWDIVPAFNPYFYFRAGYGIARACLRALYRVRVAFEDEASMADVSDKAAVVFMINHRSNIDYAVVNYLTASRTMLSFGVGEWSRVWPIQPLMRMAGGYFVRRGSDDPLYRLMLKRYVQLATEARVPHAIFLEGQLSPDGSVGEAKLGLLSYVTEFFDPENSPDIVFMPVGINYDRIPEDQNLQQYSSEEFRTKGRKYVLLQGIQFASRVIWEMLLRRRSFGYACASFGKPLSFARWLQQSDVDWPQLTRDERYYWISELGRKLTGDITLQVPATPMAILCRAWFNDTAKVFARDELESKFLKYCDVLEAGNCHIALVEEDHGKTLEFALSLALKRGLIIEYLPETYRINDRMEGLVRYSGNTISQFLKE
ncbi:MAG: 1-acyl-sn-glycerol-3-phosphate acyltransferase [Rhizobiaceae bacterium]